jgi:hypothetical protein
VQDRLATQEKSLRRELEEQFNYKMSVLEEKMKEDVRGELENNIRIEINRELKIQW